MSGCPSLRSGKCDGLGGKHNRNHCTEGWAGGHDNGAFYVISIITTMTIVQ